MATQRNYFTSLQAHYFWKPSCSIQPTKLQTHPFSSGGPEKPSGLHLWGSAAQRNQTWCHPYPGGHWPGCHGDWEAQCAEGLHVRQTQGLGERDADPEAPGSFEAPGQDVRGYSKGLEGFRGEVEEARGERGDREVEDAFRCGWCIGW